MGGGIRSRKRVRSTINYNVKNRKVGQRDGSAFGGYANNQAVNPRERMSLEQCTWTLCCYGGRKKVTDSTQKLKF